MTANSFSLPVESRFKTCTEPSMVTNMLSEGCPSEQMVSPESQSVVVPLPSACAKFLERVLRTWYVRNSFRATGRNSSAFILLSSKQ